MNATPQKSRRKNKQDKTKATEEKKTGGREGDLGELRKDKQRPRERYKDRLDRQADRERQNDREKLMDRQKNSERQG